MADTTSSLTAPAGTQRPFLTIVHGNPSPQETAALTVLFAALAHSASTAAEENAERNRWGNFQEKLASPISYNPSSFMNVSFY